MKAITPCRFAAILTIGLICSFSGRAQTSWTGSGVNSNLGNSANWNNSILPPNDGTAAVTFGGAGTSSINVDTPYSFDTLTLSGATGYQFGGATLSIKTSILDSAAVGVGFNSPISLTGNANFTNSSTAPNTSLFFNTINLGSNTLNLNPSGSSTAYITVSGNIGGTGGVVASGSGVTFLTGTANSYSGGTTINAGARLQIGDPSTGSGASVGSLPGNVLNNGTIHFKETSGASYTYAGVISGTGGLLKLGAGTLILTGANSFSGGTTISDGELSANGANVGPVTVNGGQLSGSGSFTGTLTVNSGGMILPINRVGNVVPSTLSVGATTLNGNTGYTWVLADPRTVSPGTNWSLLDVTGTLALNGSAGSPIVLKLTTENLATHALGATGYFDTLQNYSFTIASTTGGITGFNASYITIDLSNFVDANSHQWAVALSGDSKNLLLNYTGGTAIPEPASCGFLAGIVACGLVVWRRRQPL